MRRDAGEVPAATADSTLLEALADGAALEVPALWPLEVANALTVLVRRRKLTEDERRTALGWLRGLRVRVDHETASLAFSRLSDLATALQLSVHDAAYLELAHRRRLVLGCKDGPLRRAAAACGASLWPPCRAPIPARRWPVRASPRGTDGGTHPGCRRPPGCRTAT